MVTPTDMLRSIRLEKLNFKTICVSSIFAFFLFGIVPQGLVIGPFLREEMWTLSLRLYCLIISDLLIPVRYLIRLNISELFRTSLLEFHLDAYMFVNKGFNCGRMKYQQICYDL